MSGRLFSLPILAAAGFGLMSPSAAQAYSYKHIDGLALTLQRQTAELHREVHLHFRSTPSYRHLDEDVADMERLARHIHDVAHRRGSVVHLRRDVEDLDRLYHHVEDLIRTMTIRGRLDPRTVAHFRSVMAAIGRTLHHLRDDLDHLVHDGHGSHGGIGHGGYGHGHGGYGHGGVGLRIPFGDRGGFTIRLPIR